MTRKKSQESLKDRLHKRASDWIQSQALVVDESSRGFQDRNTLENIISRFLEDENEILTQKEASEIVQAVVNRIVGLGPIEPLLKDPDITEIMVNSPSAIFIERAGTLESVSAVFRDQDHILSVIERIVSPLGRRVDESVPFVDARLPDGSRVNAIIPPLALGSPALTIRRFSKEPFTLDRLVKMKTVSRQAAQFLKSCVRARLNILISGGTGSGKTSTLNALTCCIPESERIVTIEDTAELQVSASNLVSLEARPPNIEGQGEISIRNLMRNALRMRPDRIIIGEVRGLEAFDMLQAMNTGHPGSLTTIHANSPEDAIHRLESMVLMAELGLPQSAIREQIGSAVDLILQQKRLTGGERKIVSIAEVHSNRGEDWRSTRVETKDIFINESILSRTRSSHQAALKPTGYQPSFLEKIHASS